MRCTATWPMRGWIVAVLAVLAGCSGRYHPENFAEAAIHGPATTKLTSDCRRCHGADLTGGSSGVSCDGCHAGATPTAWRTNCTFCHGGVDNNTGAPPRNLDGTDHVGPFPSHTAHVTGGAMAAAYDCTECHVKAKDVLTPGHLFGNPPGGALNDFGAGRSPQATFDRTTGTCANVYCHGNGRGDNGTILANAPALACNGCHPTQISTGVEWAGMSGPHGAHLGDGTGTTCGDCHAATTSDGLTIKNVSLHINGKPDVVIATAGFTYDQTAGTCTGTCHGVTHTSYTWTGSGGGKYHPDGFEQGSVHGPEMELQRQDCRTCHGADLTGGNGAGGSLIGPSCDGCHSGATPTAWRTNCTFCHGGGNGDTQGMPPRDPGSTNTSVSQRFIAHAIHASPTMMSPNACTTCHLMPADVLSMGHAFNTFDMLPNVVFDTRNAQATYNGTGTCASLYCHGNGQGTGNNGTATDGTAPLTCTSCHGGQANNRAGLTSEHRNDHDGVACAECHYATMSSGSTVLTGVTMHINGTRDVVFRQGGSYDPTTKQCTNVACHGTHTW